MSSACAIRRSHISNAAHPQNSLRHESYVYITLAISDSKHNTVYYNDAKVRALRHLKIAEKHNNKLDFFFSLHFDPVPIPLVWFVECDIKKVDVSMRLQLQQGK
jgi:hypothetical protein